MQPKNFHPEHVSRWSEHEEKWSMDERQNMFVSSKWNRRNIHQTDHQTPSDYDVTADYEIIANGIAEVRLQPWAAVAVMEQHKRI